jgi:hypothetical protein
MLSVLKLKSSLCLSELLVEKLAIRLVALKEFLHTLKPSEQNFDSSGFVHQPKCSLNFVKC